MRAFVRPVGWLTTNLELCYMLYRRLGTGWLGITGIIHLPLHYNTLQLVAVSGVW